MPEADVEIRHLFKTAELAHANSARLRIDVVLKCDKDAPIRYERLFGKSLTTISNGGLEQWVLKSLQSYIPHDNTIMTLSRNRAVDGGEWLHEKDCGIPRREYDGRHDRPRPGHWPRRVWRNIPDALRDLANGFDEHGYSLDRNAVTVEVWATSSLSKDRRPSDAIRNLASIIEDRGYAEQDYPDLDWAQIAAEFPPRILTAAEPSVEHLPGQPVLSAWISRLDGEFMQPLRFVFHVLAPAEAINRHPTASPLTRSSIFSTSQPGVSTSPWSATRFLDLMRFIGDDLLSRPTSLWRPVKISLHAGSSTGYKITYM